MLILPSRMATGPWNLDIGSNKLDFGILGRRGFPTQHNEGKAVELTQHTLPILRAATFRETLSAETDFLGSANRSIQER